MPISLYALIEGRPGHPNFGQPLYVGIGNRIRPRAHIRDAKKPAGCRNRLLNLAIREHLAQGIEPQVKIIAMLDTREKADAAERELIGRLGRLGRDPGGILCNVAHGGDGPDSALMSDPETVEKLRIAGIARFADPAVRAAHGQTIAAFYNDPAVRQQHAAKVKRGLAIPEIRERHLAGLERVNANLSTEDRRAAADRKSEDGKARSIGALRAANADPAIQARRRENSRQPQKDAWADPEIRARRVAAMKGKKKTMTPAAIAARAANSRLPRSAEAIAAQRDAANRNWADPEMRAHLSAARAAAWEDPQARKNMLAGRSEGIAKSWDDPSVRERRTAGVAQTVAAKWADDPEYAERARAGLRAAWQDPERRAARIAKMLDSRRRKAAERAVSCNPVAAVVGEHERSD